jgi:hypothetical protein
VKNECRTSRTSGAKANEQDINIRDGAKYYNESLKLLSTRLSSADKGLYVVGEGCPSRTDCEE